LGYVGAWKSIARESCSPTHGEQLLPTPLATADPGGVPMVRDAVAGSPAHEVDAVLAYVDQAKTFLLDRIVVVPVDE
jgi:hypothetical protein